MLGYSSWDDYCTREFGTSRLKLPREDRAEHVASLRESGLSIRAIASATGSSKNTIKSDLRQVGQFDPPVPDEHGDTETGEIIDQPATTGLDGKQYQRPAIRTDPKPEPNRELELVNDIREQLNFIGTSRQHRDRRANQHPRRNNGTGASRTHHHMPNMQRNRTGCTDSGGWSDAEGDREHGRRKSSDGQR